MEGRIGNHSVVQVLRAQHWPLEIEKEVLVEDGRKEKRKRSLKKETYKENPGR